MIRYKLLRAEYETFCDLVAAVDKILEQSVRLAKIFYGEIYFDIATLKHTPLGINANRDKTIDMFLSKPEEMNKACAAIKEIKYNDVMSKVTAILANARHTSPLQEEQKSRDDVIFPPETQKSVDDLTKHIDRELMSEHYDTMTSIVALIIQNPYCGYAITTCFLASIESQIKLGCRACWRLRFEISTAAREGTDNIMKHIPPLPFVLMSMPKSLLHSYPPPTTNLAIYCGDAPFPVRIHNAVCKQLDEMRLTMPPGVSEHVLFLEAIRRVSEEAYKLFGDRSTATASTSRASASSTRSLPAAISRRGSFALPTASSSSRCSAARIRRPCRGRAAAASCASRFARSHTFMGSIRRSYTATSSRATSYAMATVMRCSPTLAWQRKRAVRIKRTCRPAT